MFSKFLSKLAMLNGMFVKFKSNLTLHTATFAHDRATVQGLYQRSEGQGLCIPLGLRQALNPSVGHYRLD